MIDIKVKKPNIDLKHIKSWSLFWTFVSVLIFLVTISITVCVMLQPFDTSVVSESTTLGFWHIAENIPSLSILFYLSISLFGLTMIALVIICAIDQRIYRFRFSAPFMRMSFIASIWNAILIIIGICSQPIAIGDHFANLIWNYQNNHHVITNGGAALIIFSCLFMFYFLGEMAVGIVHENKIFFKIPRIQKENEASLRHIFNGYIDPLTIFYARIFGFIKRIYKKPKFKQHLIKWHLINRYIVYNFIYSLLFTFCLIFIIVFACMFSRTNPYDAIHWFVPMFIFLLCLFLVVVFAILNILHTLKKLRRFDFKSHSKTHLCYTLGLFIPWVGCIHEIYVRHHINDEQKQLIIYKKIKNKAIVITFETLKVTMAVLLSVVAVPIGFVAATLVSKYNPPISRFNSSTNQWENLEDLKMDDTRNQPSKEHGISVDGTHSALTYNVGFNAYNQDMHFFNDTPGHFLNGQSWAENTPALKQSLNGVARTIGMYHDTNYDGHFHKYNWDNHENNASNLRGVRTIWQSNFDNEAQWQNDECVYGPSGTVDNIFDDKSDSGYTADTVLGTKNGLFDFVSIEELDRDSTRSYNVDEYNDLRNAEIWYDDNTNGANVEEIKDHYASTYAYNFIVPYVPVPLNQPMGQVVGGLSTLSKYNSLDTINKRYALTSIPGIYGLFQLRRCLIVTQVPVIKDGVPLIFDGHPVHFTYITGHLDAYDNGGYIRRLQLKTINDIFENELFTHKADGTRDKQTGNYVLMGADWNLTLPQTKGYEGSEMDESYDPKDPAVAPFNWREYNYKANPVDSDNPNSWKQYEQYNKNKEYRKGDIVEFQTPYDLSTGTEDVNNVKGIGLQSESKALSDDSTYTDFDGTKKSGTALFEAVRDVPKNEPPSKDKNNNEEIFEENNTYWKYYINPIYEQTSLNKTTRYNMGTSNVLPSIVDPTVNTLTADPLDNLNESRIANFYGNHAMPSSRNAGVRYFGNNSHISQLSDLTQTKHSIDGFLASYNIKVNGTFGYDNNFVYADHMPVSINFELIPPTEA